MTNKVWFQTETVPEKHILYWKLGDSKNKARTSQNSWQSRNLSSKYIELIYSIVCLKRNVEKEMHLFNDPASWELFYSHTSTIHKNTLSNKINDNRVQNLAVNRKHSTWGKSVETLLQDFIINKSKNPLSRTMFCIKICVQ